MEAIRRWLPSRLSKSSSKRLLPLDDINAAAATQPPRHPYYGTIDLDPIQAKKQFADLKGRVRVRLPEAASGTGGPQP